ncbi:(2Fe-2S)-binding protein, partial [Streptomyces albiaxialis]|uniref:(2Fe-2S)-binding protein n=1 Tax=Streptomyces albiaxialis TaxID=329523 RepID=UPI0031D5C34F
WRAGGGDPAARVLGPLRRARAQARAFAARLARAHPVGPGWSGDAGWLRDGTVVCRCEGTTYGALRAAAADPATGDPRVTKLVTRAGLGPCQGRVCGATVAELTTRLTPPATGMGGGRPGHAGATAVQGTPAPGPDGRPDHPAPETDVGTAAVPGNPVPGADGQDGFAAYRRPVAQPIRLGELAREPEAVPESVPEAVPESGPSYGPSPEESA